MDRRSIVLSLTLSLAGLLAAGCSQKRMAMDYEVQVGHGFGYEYRPETERFASGEQFRLRFTTHEDLYVYMFNKGTSGACHVLFPHPRILGGDNLVEGWQWVVIPPPNERHGAYMFDRNPGIETLIIVASQTRQPDLERIVHRQLTDPAAISEILHRLEADSKRDGHFQKNYLDGHTQIVLESPSRDAVMVNVVRLEHQPRP